MVTAAGLIWGAHVSTNNFTNLNALFPLPSGPMEICAVGILVWLHAKWRLSVREK
jgi:hypothetical protein